MSPTKGRTLSFTVSTFPRRTNHAVHFAHNRTPRRRTITAQGNISNDNTSPPRNIVVVGAGIIGLTTAIRLAEEKHNVTVIAQETPTSILQRQPGDDRRGRRGTYTSSGSGGFWYPVFLGGDQAAIQRWGAVTYGRLEEEVRQGVQGVHMREGFILSARKEPVLEWFADMAGMSVVRHTDDERVPPEYCGALKFRTPIVHMDVYLPYLEGRLRALGVDVRLTRDVNGGGGDDDGDGGGAWDIDRVWGFARGLYGRGAIVVNCAGVGAGRLTGETMLPGRGVTARIAAPKGKDYFITETMGDAFLSDEGKGTVAYALPRGEGEYTLGGTMMLGDWREVASEEEVEGVLQRALRLLGVAEGDVAVTEVWTGLRPITGDGAAKVGDVVDGGAAGEFVVSNFGHGGSGVTTCWGCAEQIANVVGDLRA